MKKKMFYGASNLIFQKAKHLRNHVTPSEMIFWVRLKECFPNYHFRRQHPLSNYIADFYSHKLKLAIELDGSVHDLEENRKKDIERQAAIELLGIAVLRFTNEEIKNRIESCMEIITDYIASLK